MSETRKIKFAIEKSTKALTLKPSWKRSIGISKTSIKNGMTCEVQEGNWKFLGDMPESIGGEAPGAHGRASLGSCLAICYALKAAKLNIPLILLEVEVQADYDDGALLGIADIAPGDSEVRYIITIESEASKEDILKMLDDADRHSPYLDIFSREQNCKREIHIVSPKAQS